MQFQRAPLPPDVEYFLDCANEEDAIGSFDHAVLTLLGDRKIVASIIDGPDVGRGWRVRWNKCLLLDAYALELVADLPRHEQTAFAAVGMRWEPLHILRIAEYLIHFNFEDETSGGAGKDYLRYPRHDRNYDPTPGARRRLYAPSAIRRYAKREDQDIPHSRLLAAGLKRLPAPMPADADLINELAQEQREAYKATYLAARAKFEAEQKARWTKLHGDAFDRRAVQRATRFCSNLIGVDKVSAFARGQAVALQGQGIIIEVARNRSIGTMGHGALDVRLCADDGTRLANICVYFDKTPAIDQLAAIAMHVGAGDDAAVIETGNLFNITKAGTNHPVVLARMSKKSAEFPRPIQQSDRELQKSAMERYKDDVIAIYIRAVRDQIWGREARRLDPFIDAMAEAAAGAEERIAA